MSKLAVKNFVGMYTKGDSKDIPPEASYQSKNMVNLKGRCVTRPGCVKFGGFYQGAVNLIYNFKRIARGSVNLVQTRDKLYTLLNPDFIAIPLWGERDLTVYFFDWTLDWFGEITGYKWNFGDGGSSTEKYPVHIYTSTGIFDVTLTVYVGSLEFSITRYKLIWVYDPSLPSDPETNPWSEDDLINTINPFVQSITPGEVVEGYDATTSEWICQFVLFTTGTPPIFVALRNANDINTFASSDIAVTSVTRFNATLQPGLERGKYDAIVVDSLKRRAFKQNAFEVTQHIPVVSSINPSSVEKGYSNESITITGNYFYDEEGADNVDFVYFGGAGDVLGEQVVASKTSITGIIPLDLAIGEYQVVVRNKSGDESTEVVNLTVVGITDTTVKSFSPTTNFSNATAFYVYKDYNNAECRTLFKVGSNKTLHIYCFSRSGTQVASVYEVNPDSFDIATVTWNNQPAVGDLITTFQPIENTWSEISTGTTGAIMIKLSAGTPAYDWNYHFRSMEYADEAYRPYVT